MSKNFDRVLEAATLSKQSIILQTKKVRGMKLGDNGLLTFTANTNNKDEAYETILNDLEELQRVLEAEIGRLRRSLGYEESYAGGILHYGP